ncbi:MAG: hypothetical protein ABI586_02320 [Candidatus Nanopelagicales bacterium]
MSMSFHEKSLWVSLAGLLLAFCGYFYSAYFTVLRTAGAKDVLPLHAGLFIGATVVLVLVLVGGHVVIALLDRRTETDERDRSIEIRGGLHGSYVLAIGVFLTLCTALITEGNAVMAHVLLGSWVLAQGVEIISQLVMYRRGH